MYVGHHNCIYHLLYICVYQLLLPTIPPLIILFIFGYLLPVMNFRITFRCIDLLHITGGIPLYSNEKKIHLQIINSFELLNYVEAQDEKSIERGVTSILDCWVHQSLALSIADTCNSK